MVAPIKVPDQPSWKYQHPDQPQRPGCRDLAGAFVVFALSLFIVFGVLYAAVKVVKAAWEG